MPRPLAVLPSKAEGSDNSSKVVRVHLEDMAYLSVTCISCYALSIRDSGQGHGRFLVLFNR